MRQEAAWRSYAVTAELAPTASREIAAILTAYDQWWQDARIHFQKYISPSRTPSVDGQNLDPFGFTSLVNGETVEGQQSAEFNIGSGTSRTTTSRGTLRSRKFNCLSPFKYIWRKLFGKVKSVEASNSQRHEIKVIRSSTLEEVHQIRYTAQRLAANRSSSGLVRAWIAIAIPLGSVAGGCYRAVYQCQSRQNSQTSHTLAAVMLFSFLFLAVYLNGHVGNFHDQNEVLNTLRELRNSSSAQRYVSWVQTSW